MAGFLSGRRFDLVRGDSHLRFDADGGLGGTLNGVPLRGSWSATMTLLRLMELELLVDGSWERAEDRELPIRWLDGKLNVSIDGQNYRDFSWSHRG